MIKINYTLPQTLKAFNWVRIPIVVLTINKQTKHDEISNKSKPSNE